MKNEQHFVLQFIYSEKATKFCEILTILLSYAQTVKSKVKISQNFVAFLEYINFTIANLRIKCVTETKNVSVLFYKIEATLEKAWVQYRLLDTGKVHIF